jgi:nucleoside-diphosphate-sugar epimerase
MQTILGSGGGIGMPLAKELTKYTSQIRLVSRNPKKVNESDELFPLDVNDLIRIDQAIVGSEVVYVTIGFPYQLKIWKEIWPAFMQTVIDSCKKHNAKLVFLDNVYMYAKSAIPNMTEDSPILPPSKKGEIRKQLHEMIMNEVEKKNINALIARSADFYGPNNKNSALSIMVLENLIKGKKAQAMGDLNKIHTYTFTPDAAKATAILGNTADAYNQVWHLPTTNESLSNLNWIELIANELGVEPKIQNVPAWMIRILGLFIPLMRELPEMNYQLDRDYVFNSSKFEERFGISATAPKEGIRILVESLNLTKQRAAR